MIGITDQEEEGVWRLFNGEPAAYFAWADHGDYTEPDGGTAQNDVQMVTTKGASSNWRSPGEWLDVTFADNSMSTYCTFEPIPIEDQLCFSLRTEYSTEDATVMGTNEIEFSYNDILIHKFITGVQDPALCLQQNKLNLGIDNFKFKSTGNGVNSKKFNISMAVLIGLILAFLRHSYEYLRHVFGG